MLLKNLLQNDVMVGLEGERQNPMGEHGIPQSSLETSRRLNALPKDAYEVVAMMSSHFLAQDLAQSYLRNRAERLFTANIFRELGVKGKELGFVMQTLHDLAAGNAQPRRRSINRRFI